MTKAEAIQALEAAGHVDTAHRLDAWRDKDGNNLGWDGWLRGEFPEVVAHVFPNW